ncbi:hypothetical protein AMTR_s00063p00136670 [Amborella trichopoda]|uniref:Uncharacterized protein n=1 Tax=Amborella trichopoda TaxID=13333 RepID=U5CSM9_AMBTC|nr:hypothetical protein AMTR_s00063p00136670 [Amborella trichopoda]
MAEKALNKNTNCIGKAITMEVQRSRNNNLRNTGDGDDILAKRKNAQRFPVDRKELATTIS